ncbi:acyltransferase family protein [Kitasatospora sp. NPDC051853]|uniref:acyltransferase family protein n=1 Tax=Kitasatospora sp. NPDC051853 TaxID=3364058 RepID=UPI00379A91A3
MSIDANRLCGIGRRGGTRPLRLHALTGTRFLAALAVFLFHVSLARLSFSPYRDGTAGLLQWVLDKAGWVGVSYFFVLSGFVLTWGARPGMTARQFWRRRAARLYPSHLVTAAAALLVFAWATTGWRELVPNLLLVQVWIPRFTTFFSVNIPSWSLSCELFFYACFPLLHRWVRRIDPARLWTWVAALAAAVVCLPALALAVLPDGPAMPNGFPVSVWQYWFVYLLPPVRALEFVLGILLARALQTGQRGITLRPLTAFALTLGGYAVAMSVPFLYGLTAATVIPLVLLLHSVAGDELAGRRSWLASRPMVWLGELSFSFYLVHVPVLILLRGLVDHRTYAPLPATGMLLLTFAASLGAAWVLNRWVERPLFRLLAGRGPRSGLRAPAIPAQRKAPSEVKAG